MTYIYILPSNTKFCLKDYHVWDNDLGFVICEIRIDEAAGPRDSDSWMTSFDKTPINYESHIVRCTALPWLVICENE